MEEAWHEIEEWLKAEFPMGLANLGRPAVDAEIKSAEKTFGGPMPDGLRTLLAIHNGEQPAEIWLLGNWSLLSSQYIEKAWLDQSELSLQLDCELEPDDYVKPGLWNRQWYPFAYDGSGGYLCIDMDPAPPGARGQVIATNSDGFSRRIAKSIAMLFDLLAHALKNGQFEVVDDCLEADGEWWN